MFIFYPTFFYESFSYNGIYFQLFRTFGCSPPPQKKSPMHYKGRFFRCQVSDQMSVCIRIQFRCWKHSLEYNLRRKTQKENIKTGRWQDQWTPFAANMSLCFCPGKIPGGHHDIPPPRPRSQDASTSRFWGFLGSKVKNFSVWDTFAQTTGKKTLTTTKYTPKCEANSFECSHVCIEYPGS